MAEDADDDLDAEAEDAEDAEEGADAEGAENKKGGKKKLLFIAAPAALLLLLGGGAAFFLMGGEDEVQTAEAGEAGDDGDPLDQRAEEGVYVAEMSEHPEFYQLPELLVNIEASSGGTTYLKLNLMFQIPDPEMAALLDARMPLVMNQYQGFLRELREEDLYGSAGTHRLRLELLRRANLALAPSRIDAVLIQDMLIQ